MAAASSTARARGRGIAPADKHALRAIAPLPVALLRVREFAGYPPLERFGIRRSASWRRSRAPRWPAASAPLGRSRATSRAVAAPAAPPQAAERLEERLAKSASGPQLERALGLLIDRMLARRERRGRATLRAAVLSAKLVEGGTWRARVTFQEALADPRRMRLVLTPKLAELPPPRRGAAAARRGLRPRRPGDQRSLLAQPAPIPRRPAARGRSPGAFGRGPRRGAADPSVDPDSRVPGAGSLTPWEP